MLAAASIWGLENLIYIFCCRLFGVDEVFFPGSDDEVGFVEEEVNDELRFV